MSRDFCTVDVFLYHAVTQIGSGTVLGGNVNTEPFCFGPNSPMNHVMVLVFESYTPPSLTTKVIFLSQLKNLNTRILCIVHIEAIFFDGQTDR